MIMHATRHNQTYAFDRLDQIRIFLWTERTSSFFLFIRKLFVSIVMPSCSFRRHFLTVHCEKSKKSELARVLRTGS